MTDSEDQLQRIGSRVRGRRAELGLTVRQLAERSGLSPRFLSDVEWGKSNISVSRLTQLAEALELPLLALLRPTYGDARQRVDALIASCTEPELERLVRVIEVALGRRSPPIVALIGVRGAGKSAIGQGLAARLELPFVELAYRIEARAGMPLGDVFTLHGQAFYRTIELECFVDLVDAGQPCVVALPGGIVTSEQAMDLMRSSCTSVWLRATAELYWERVFAQGDTRPMSGRTHAMADLRALMARRAPLYEQADLVVDTSNASIEEAVTTVVAALDARAINADSGRNR